MPADFSMDVAEKRPQGFTISRRMALALLAAVAAIIVLTAVFTHKLTSCSGQSKDRPFLTKGSQKSLHELTKVKDVRLPRSVVPDSYHVTLVPHLWGESSNFTFTGHVSIIVNVTSATNNITLHANELIVKCVVV
jgi:hypothetical protein